MDIINMRILNRFDHELEAHKIANNLIMVEIKFTFLTNSS